MPLVLSLAATLILLELAFRALLFLDVPGLEKRAALLRRPENYFRTVDPDFWTGSIVLAPDESLKPVPTFDPLVGWLGHRISPRTYEHRDEKLLGPRRPVLLYGDSFAECATDPIDCWQGLMYHSERGAELGLLNYGVGGYGLDQIYLLMRESLDRFVDRDPIVIVSILVDDDLDRSALSFRCWPKPRFRVADGKLVGPEPPTASTEEYLAEHPPGVWSWAWRFLSHRREMRAATRAEIDEPRREEVRELSRALLLAVQHELDSRGVQWFVAVFQGQSALNPAVRRRLWQVPFLEDTLRELGIPFVTSWKAMSEHSAATGTDPKLYFLLSGPGQGHFNPLGNEAAFPCLLHGIDGSFD